MCSQSVLKYNTNIIQMCCKPNQFHPLVDWLRVSSDQNKVIFRMHTSDIPQSTICQHNCCAERRWQYRPFAARLVPPFAVKQNVCGSVCVCDACYEWTASHFLLLVVSLGFGLVVFCVLCCVVLCDRLWWYALLRYITATTTTCPTILCVPPPANQQPNPTNKRPQHRTNPNKTTTKATRARRWQKCGRGSAATAAEWWCCVCMVMVCLVCALPFEHMFVHKV